MKSTITILLFGLSLGLNSSIHAQSDVQSDRSVQQSPALTQDAKTDRPSSTLQSAKGIPQANAELPIGKLSSESRPEIEGLWGMDIAENPQCVEYYNFKPDNEMVINSGAEWSVGQYQYQPPDDPTEQPPILKLHIQYDNNEKDCSGLQEDQSNEMQQFYVKWKNPRQIQFCGGEKGDQCFATLNKQLP